LTPFRRTGGPLERLRHLAAPARRLPRSWGGRLDHRPRRQRQRRPRPPL